MSSNRVRIRGLWCFAACLMASSAPAEAVRADADVEIFGGLVGISPRLSGTYDASYTPSRVGGITQLFETLDARSRARQILSLQGSSGNGFGLGLAVYPHRVLGIQMLLDRARADLSGTNPPHAVDLVWDSINFPSSEPVVRRASFTYEAPDTAARLKMLTLSLNGVARFKAGSRVSGSVSAGASYFRAQAEGGVVSALAGWLGGHAVLFSELFQMSLTTETANALGINLGGDVSLALGSQLALFVDGRYFHAPSTKAKARLKAFVGSTITSVPLAQVERYLAFPPVDLDPRHLRLLIGLKWLP